MIPPIAMSVQLLKTHAKRVLPILLKRLPLLGVVSLAACSTLESVGTPANPERWLEREVNACLPTAIVFKESLQRYGVWADVVTYKAHDPIKNKNESHAVVVFNYPPGKDSYWTYDFEGSFKIGDSSAVGSQRGSTKNGGKGSSAAVDVKDPAQIAQMAEKSRFRSYRQILEADFLR